MAAKGSKAKSESGESGPAKKRKGAKAAVTPARVPTSADAELTGKAAEEAEEYKEEVAAVRSGSEMTARSWSALLRAGDGFVLTDLGTRSTPGFEGRKKEGKQVMADLQDRLSDLQERLFAESVAGGTRSVLLVIQGMDTAGKGGIMRHVVGSVDPQGVEITSFEAPTQEELNHSFLWRIRNALPGPGRIGVFDRSHYEDVLIVRVNDLVPRAQWSRRYSQINDFERKVVDSGTTVVKVMLHISSDEQKERLQRRLERPDKHWKFDPADITERGHWLDYSEAYQAMLEKTSTDDAPWFVVPADRKWYARLAVTNLLLEHLEAMDPRWPVADFDVEEMKRLLAASP